MSATMKAVRFYRYGGPEVLQVEDVPVPQARAGEVLIKVAASGVNYADTMRRWNTYLEPTPLPYTPGGEVAGTVEALGEDVGTVAVGTSVLAATPAGGGYAQYATIPAGQLIPLPPQLDPVRATAVLVQGLSAHLLLKASARLQPGESVLVQAAAGGVGTLAVQLAKRLGAGRVIAAASSSAKLELARSLGADAGVNYTHDEWPQQVLDANGGRGVDVILEMAGGPVFERNFDCLAPFGRVVVFGLASGQPTSLDPQRLLGQCQSIIGFYLGQFFAQPELIRTSLGELMEEIISDRLKLHVGHMFPLSRIAEAHRLLEGRQTTGKVVLQPWADA